MESIPSKSNGGSKRDEEVCNQTTENDTPECKGTEFLDGQQRMPYKKRPGTSSISGHLYEIYIAMHFLLQGKKLCEESKIKDFHLATNMDDAGDLDDVVFRYRYTDQSGEEKTKVIFLQAKHRNNTEKDILTLDKLISEDYRKDYRLEKVFNAYRKIKMSFTEVKDHTIFGSHFNECELIFFTNTKSSFDESDKNVEKIKVHDTDILNIRGDDYCYKLKLGGNNDIKIMDHLNNLSTYKMLAKHLVECIFCNENADGDNAIMNFYYGKLSNEVIEKTETGKVKFRDSFLSAEKDSFKQMFIKEIQSREGFGELSKEDLIAQLATKNLKLPKNFWSVRPKHSKQPLEKDVVYDDEIVDFLSRLRIFVNQPKESVLRDLIKKQMQTKFAVLDSDIESAFCCTRVKVETWWKDQNSYFLTENTTFYEESARVSIRFDVRDPVDLFTGREEVLKELHDAFQRRQGDDKIAVISAVSGLGGIGKTELARKYVQVYSQIYENNIVWINAEKYDTLCESFHRLGEKLKICKMEGKCKSIKCIVEEVFLFFSRRKCLFVFNNAQKYRSERDGDEGIGQFMPSLPLDSKRPYILITSRNHEWGNIEVLSLDTFTDQEAGKFIRKALKLAKESEETEVKMLAETLQYFPLALQQAVAYIREKNKALQIVGSRFCITHYVDRYKKETEKLLNYQFPDDSSDLYRKTTFTTWAITTDKIEENTEYGEQAILILRIIAYLYESGIPVEIFRTNGKTEFDDELLGTILRKLQQYSMICVTDRVINVHKLVQEVTRINTKKVGKELYIVNKVYELLINSAGDCKNTAAGADRMRRLLPHFETFLTHIHGGIPNSQDMVETLLREMARMYETTGNPRRQQELLSRKLMMQETRRTPEDLKIVGTIVRLSNSYANLGDFLQQKKLLERALNILESHNCADSVEAAFCFVNLGVACGDLGDPLKMKEKLEKAFGILENHYGTDHVEVARCLVNLGNAYGDLGEPLKKKNLLERARRIFEGCYGNVHCEVAITLINLGNAYGELGKHTKKIELLKRALRIQKEQYGADNFQVAKCYVNLGNTYGDLGKPLIKKEYLEKALQMKRKHYGADNFEVAICLVNLGNAWGALGKPAEQKKFLERSLPILEKHYGPEHFRVAITRINLGIATGDLNKKKRLLERALEMLQEHYGTDHFQVARCLANLGNAYGALGECLEKKKILERALQMLRKHYGANQFEVARCLANLGYAYGALGGSVEKKKLLEKVLEIVENRPCPDHFEIASCLANLGNAYGALGVPQEQIKLLKTAMQMKRKCQNPYNFEFSGFLANLGNAYGALGKLLDTALKMKENLR